MTDTDELAGRLDECAEDFESLSLEQDHLRIVRMVFKTRAHQCREAAAALRALRAERDEERRQAGEKHDEANRYVNELVDAKATLAKQAQEIAEMREKLATLCDAVMADITEAKRRLNADVEKDGPAHPVAAFLTGLAIPVGKARARSLAQGETT